jgi:hypothetical protein
MAAQLQPATGRSVLALAESFIRILRVLIRAILRLACSVYCRIRHRIYGNTRTLCRGAQSYYAEVCISGCLT